jgi:hypothetical protein
MIAQIQTHLSHFLTKLTAIALFLFILTSFNLQIITANAQSGTTPAPKPDTTKTTDNKVVANKSTYEEDKRIGSLKNCSVDNKSTEYQTKLKTDPTEANTFIFNCLKDIIQIVITISVILAVMRLIFVGIKFLNTFGDEAALQGELSKTITGFVAGAVILGLFATIIQVVNPSALKIDKIFSAQVIADYKCLNKGISDKNAATTGAGCKDTKQGSGPGGSTAVSGGPQNDAEINKVLSSDKPEDQTAKTELIKKLSDCNNKIAFESVAQASECQKYQSFTGAYTEPSDLVAQNIISGNSFANGDYTNIVVNPETNVTTALYENKKGNTSISLIPNSKSACSKSPFYDSPTPAKISKLNQISYEGCIFKLSM